MASYGITYHHVLQAAHAAVSKVAELHSIGAIYRGMKPLKAIFFWKSFVEPLRGNSLQLVSLSAACLKAMKVVEQKFWASALGPMQNAAVPFVRLLLGVESSEQRQVTLAPMMKMRAAQRAVMASDYRPGLNTFEFSGLKSLAVTVKA